ncbi:alpha/beta fold hydrolase [Tenacibaculum sp. MEBiC06402]|uniref:alpha/beta fold hydrolase n=1 Tax=unclassified Tenacibaculum TaxID=2635139 RepID=UPI003B9AFEDE
MRKTINITNQSITLKDKRLLGFAEYGNPNGYPIIYCHGSQSSRLEMHYDLSFVIKNNLKIITIDRPGHGLSEFNPNGSILNFAKDVKQLIDFLQIEQFSVVGMSAGAPFALGISYLYPDRIYKVAIISGFIPLNKGSKKYLSKEVKSLLLIAELFPFALKLALKIQYKKITKSPKLALESFIKIMSESDKKLLENDLVIKLLENTFKEAFRNGSKGVAFEISKILVKDWNFELSKIQVPVTIWHGEKDNNVPVKWAELLKDEINEARLKLYPHKGHLLIFEFTEEIFSNLKPSSFI